jgi:hypothetical protein
MTNAMPHLAVLSSLVAGLVLFPHHIPKTTLSAYAAADCCRQHHKD